MKVIAQKGNCFLILEEKIKGKVVDVVFNSISKKVSFSSIFSRGYWKVPSNKKGAERALHIAKMNNTNTET